MNGRSVLRRVALLAQGGALAVSSIAGVAFLATSSCSSPDENRVTAIIQPDYAIYRDNIDAYLSRRCGTLDCHGQAGRAYRVYSREGLRMIDPEDILNGQSPDGGLVSGQQPTTEAEKLSNYQSIVALEPEEMSRVMATQGEDPTKLLFLRKPLRLERHKGGPAMAEDDPGFRCVEAWLRVPVVTGDGTPIPASQRSLSQGAKDLCARAAEVP